MRDSERQLKRTSLSIIAVVMQDLLGVLSKSPDGTYVYEPGALKPFQQRALAMTSGRELFNLLSEIIKLGSFLVDQKNSPKAADALFDMVAVLAPHLDKLALAEGQQGEQRSEDIRKQLSQERRAFSVERSSSRGLEPGRAGFQMRK